MHGEFQIFEYTNKTKYETTFHLISIINHNYNNSSDELLKYHNNSFEVRYLLFENLTE